MAFLLLFLGVTAFSFAVIKRDKKIIEPTKNTYVWVTTTENISVIYGSGCENRNASFSLDANKENLGKRIAIAPEKHSGNYLELKSDMEGRRGVDGIGYRANLTKDRTNLTWFGYVSNCGHDEAITREVTVYECTKLKK